MIAFDSTLKPEGKHHFAAFAGLRDGKDFVLSPDDIRRKFAANLKMERRIPDALSEAMGNQMYLATFDTEEEMNNFYSEVTKTK